MSGKYVVYTALIALGVVVLHDRFTGGTASGRSLRARAA